jgi:hypothetical protein
MEVEEDGVVMDDDKDNSSFWMLGFSTPASSKAAGEPHAGHVVGVAREM